jgi:hypothetical protein
MSLTRRIAIAGALALLAATAGQASGAPNARAVVVANVQPAAMAVAHAAFAAVDAQSARLTLAEMDATRGDGWLRKLWKVVVQVIQWIIEHLPDPRIPPRCDPVNDPSCGLLMNEETVWDASRADGTETYANTQTVNEFYADDAAYNQRSLSYSQQSESGFVLIGTTGGGGGSTCLMDDGCALAY